MAWSDQASGAPGLGEYEAALAQLGEVIGQYQEALQSLDSEYRQLLAEYQQAGGQTGTATDGAPG